MPFSNLSLLAHGLQSGQVDSVILDINVATYRPDLFNDSWCKVSKVVNFPFSFGAALRQNAVKLDRLFGAYVKENQASLMRIVQDVRDQNNTRSKEVGLKLTGKF